MYCPNCGNEISEKAEICPNCGVRPFRSVEYCYNCGDSLNKDQEMCTSCGVRVHKTSHISNTDAKSPWLMALLSFLITGLGQMILGQVKKGVAILVASILLSMITFGSSVFITTPIAIIDAFLIAKKMREGKEVGEWEFF
ncbi:zinc ribbon domain-containing protein [Texcoconibacillus texcoconensis]|uniref:Putative membrane protein YvbJ n=1 Tax=Texcoconibacillus texcoconensis TaxID=1095777 RepID=A0A840QRB1_9BACI|nr:zinc ribbon domain-containing protein [Texcoconibacillus texcoconensis]MBB5173868.1 putative membrane protein YvbJ [Texcoconibacillus texcoconensis]